MKVIFNYQFQQQSVVLAWQENFRFLFLKSLSKVSNLYFSLVLSYIFGYKKSQ